MKWFVLIVVLYWMKSTRSSETLLPKIETNPLRLSQATWPWGKRSEADQNKEIISNEKQQKSWWNHGSSQPADQQQPQKRKISWWNRREVQPEQQQQPPKEKTSTSWWNRGTSKKEQQQPKEKASWWNRGTSETADDSAKSSWWNRRGKQSSEDKTASSWKWPSWRRNSPNQHAEDTLDQVDVHEHDRAESMESKEMPIEHQLETRQEEHPPPQINLSPKSEEDPTFEEADDATLTTSSEVEKESTKTTIDAHPTHSLLEAIATRSTEFTCDITVPSGICIGEGHQVLTDPATINGQLLRITFDTIASPFASSSAKYGPGHNGGASALLTPDSNVWQVPLLVKSSDFNAFSVHGWVLVQSSAPTPPTTTPEVAVTWIEIKTDTDSLVAIGLTSDGRWAAHVNILENGEPRKITVTSLARAVPGTWNHLGVVRDSSKLHLFLNGIPIDSEALTESDLIYEKATLVFQNNGPQTVLLDTVEVYNRIMEPYEMEAVSFGALPVEPRFARLGCLQCTRTDAETSCTQFQLSGKARYLICSDAELYAGAYAVGLRMNWVDSVSNFQVWTSSSVTSDEQEMRPTICCLRS